MLMVTLVSQARRSLQPEISSLRFPQEDEDRRHRRQQGRGDQGRLRLGLRASLVPATSRLLDGACVPWVKMYGILTGIVWMWDRIL